MTPTGDTVAVADRAARPGSPGALGDLYVLRRQRLTQPRTVLIRHCSVHARLCDKTCVQLWHTALQVTAVPRPAAGPAQVERDYDGAGCAVAAPAQFQGIYMHLVCLAHDSFEVVRHGFQKGLGMVWRLWWHLQADRRRRAPREASRHRFKRRSGISEARSTQSLRGWTTIRAERPTPNSWGLGAMA